MKKANSNLTIPTGSKTATSKTPISKTPTQEAEIAALATLPEDHINISDLPEQRDWSGARRGVFFRPIKKQLTLRLDADVIDWFKTHTPSGEGYQTRINCALREHVARRGRG